MEKTPKIKLTRLSGGELYTTNIDDRDKSQIENYINEHIWTKFDSIDDKQPKTDDKLITKDKTIVGSINEIKKEHAQDVLNLQNQINDVEIELNNKQDKLTEKNAGNNITISEIDGKVIISSTGGSGDVTKEYVDQELTKKANKTDLDVVNVELNNKVKNIEGATEFDNVTIIKSNGNKIFATAISKLGSSENLTFDYIKNKQEKLIAGDNIKIENNTISVTSPINENKWKLVKSSENDGKTLSYKTEENKKYRLMFSFGNTSILDNYIYDFVKTASKPLILKTLPFENGNEYVNLSLTYDPSTGLFFSDNAPNGDMIYHINYLYELTTSEISENKEDIPQINNWIPGEFKWMPIQIDNMPDGWKKIKLDDGITLISGNEEKITPGEVKKHKHPVGDADTQGIEKFVTIDNDGLTTHTVKDDESGNYYPNAKTPDSFHSHFYTNDNLNENKNDYNVPAGISASLWQYDPQNKYSDLPVITKWKLLFNQRNK